MRKDEHGDQYLLKFFLASFKTQTIIHNVSHRTLLLYNEPALVIYNVLSSLLITIDVGRSGVLIFFDFAGTD
jgi:hypothetical protein